MPLVIGIVFSADCCDGTDEQSGKCANRCQELGAESLKALKADINAAEAGVKAKQKYISQAGDLKKKWAKRVEEVESEIAEQQQAVDAAAGECWRTANQLPYSFGGLIHQRQFSSPEGAWLVGKHHSFETSNVDMRAQPGTSLPRLLTL